MTQPSRSLLVCVFLLLSGHALLSQKTEFTEIPPVLDWFNNEIIFQQFKDPARSLRALDSLDWYSQQMGDDQIRGWYHYYRGYWYKSSNQLDSAEAHLQRAIELGDQPEWVDHNLMLNGYNALGNVFSYRGLTSEELAMHYKAMPHARSSEKLFHIATTAYNLGKVHTKLGNYQEAVPFMKECLEIDLKINDTLNIALDFNAIGLLYRKQGRGAEALDYLQQAISYADENRHPLQYLKILTSLAQSEDEHGDPSKTVPMLERARELALQHRDTLGLLSSSVALAEIFLKRQKSGQAHEIIDAVLPLAEGKGNQEIVLNAQLIKARLLPTADRQALLEQLIPLAQHLGGNELIEKTYRQSIIAYQEQGDLRGANRLQDSLIHYLQRKQTQRAEEAAVAYDLRVALSETEKDLALESVRNDYQQSNLKQQRIALIVAAALLALLSYLLWRLAQNNRLIASQKAAIERSHEEKDTLLREIHHRVKNNLQVISSLLSLQGRYSKNPQVEDAIRKGKDRVRSMSLIHQNLYQRENLTGVDVSDYLEKLFKNLFDSYNIQPGKIELSTDIEKLNLDIETVIPIGLVVNELVSNALKYAFPGDRKGEIAISLREEGNELLLTVKDDGVGIKDTERLKGDESFGYKLINTFKSKLQADLEVAFEQGTEVKLHLKKYHKVA